MQFDRFIRVWKNLCWHLCTKCQTFLLIRSVGASNYLSSTLTKFTNALILSFFFFLVILIDEESPAVECVVAAVQQSMTVWEAASTEIYRWEVVVDLPEVAEVITAREVTAAVVLMVLAAV